MFELLQVSQVFATRQGAGDAAAGPDAVPTRTIVRHVLGQIRRADLFGLFVERDGEGWNDIKVRNNMEESITALKRGLV